MAELRHATTLVLWFLLWHHTVKQSYSLLHLDIMRTISGRFQGPELSTVSNLLACRLSKLETLYELHAISWPLCKKHIVDTCPFILCFEDVKPDLWLLTLLTE